MMLERGSDLSLTRRPAKARFRWRRVTGKAATGLLQAGVSVLVQDLQSAVTKVKVLRWETLEI